MRLSAGLVTVLLLAGCAGSGGLGAACGTAPTPANARTYQLQGQVMAVRADSGELLVRHGDIKGFMPAMTMPYTLKDKSLVASLSPGDLVTASLVVEPDTAWLSAVTRIGAAPLPEDAPAGFPVATGITLIGPNDEIPDVALIDQDERPMSLSSWRGSAIALTFIYTRCPLPQYCPLLDRRFAEVQQIVQDDVAMRGRVRLVSVSFDPETDTPARLRAHATKVGAHPEVWRFATAPSPIVDRFAARFGVNVIREADTTITHNLKTAVIDARGRMVRLFDDNAWSAHELAEALRRAL